MTEYMKSLTWAAFSAATLTLWAKPAMTFAPIDSVVVEDGFWSPRFDLWRTKTLPDVLDKLDQRSHVVSNFVLAAAGARSGHEGCYFFDGLQYEAIRGASDYLRRYPSDGLDRRLDGLIDKIVAAQRPDGYLNTGVQIKHPVCRWGDSGGCLLDQHELYNAGCLIEAGVHHYRATGKAKLLAAALRFANCLCETIGPRPKRNLLPGHSLPEAALVDLARLCRDDDALAGKTGVPVRPDDYLRLVKFWFDNHGVHCGAPDFEKLGLGGEDGALATVRRMTKVTHDAGWRPCWGDYMMDRHPLADYRSIEGHAVRAVLLCDGLAAYSCETGDGDTAALARRFWESMIGRKLYITGGVGADPKFESFSPDWELPPDAYLETCAAIGNAFFSAHMAELTGDGRYMDEFERVIYNALLTAVGQDGVHYTYQNPLNTDEGARWDWHWCPCCPPMFLKLTGALPGYAYSTGEDGVSVNLFMGGSSRLKLSQGELTLRQKTAYPIDGRVEIVVNPAEPFRFVLRVRVPGWARGIENPFGLYHSEGVGPYRITVNDELFAAKLDRGYAVINREWRKDDRVILTMDVSPRLICADDRVAAVRGKVACARGPVVMAVEEKDDPTYNSFEKAIPYWQVANRGACGHCVWIDGIRQHERSGVHR